MIFYDLVSWAEKGQSPLQQMTTQQRQAVFSALAIIVLLGIVMILLVSVSARMMRRYVRGLSRPHPPNDPLARGDDWAKKPMIEVDDVDGDMDGE
jgi:hypothetical protein